MKKLFAIIISIPILTFIGFSIDFYLQENGYIEYRDYSTTGGGKEGSGKIYNIERECETYVCKKERKQKKLILTALVNRCTGFGWKTEDNIASCVKQEAYRDLQIQEQEYKLRALEEKMLSSNVNNPVIEQRPFFLEILDFYIEEAENKNNAQLRRDIMLLKNQTASMQNQRQTQAALESLYRDN
ncbi:hypothetical protein N8800_03185 [Gammaproteobacteria bacterium]|nr:hypothetical protein [Gammaproteobacteria bacterium]